MKVEFSLFMNHIGRKNAITRQELCRITGLTDSTMRKGIKDLIDSGHVILSNCRSKGYYLPDSYEEINSYIDELTRKGISCLSRANSAKKMLQDKSQFFMGFVENQ